MLLGTRDLQLQPALSPVTALDRDLAPLSYEEKLVVVREQLAEVGGYFRFLHILVILISI